MPKSVTRILPDCFAGSPFFKYEIEGKVLPAFAVNAETNKIKLEEVLLPNEHPAAEWYGLFCKIGYNPYLPGEVMPKHPEMWIKSTDGGIRPTKEMADWMRERLRPAIESGKLGESFANI